ncbi:hypothetical protein GCM10008938_18600 [Deinococcus roseus]|uniref:Uncharacterized protein n=1 Tax=Deinococcus roseus TaxID=392414 RepID=A0ABQ2CYD2_9DEIO|nr:hypothetical protein GCM10008938_18600 [Deinococcus roseus]
MQLNMQTLDMPSWVWGVWVEAPATHRIAAALSGIAVQSDLKIYAQWPTPQLPPRADMRMQQQKCSRLHLLPVNA